MSMEHEEEENAKRRKLSAKELELAYLGGGEESKDVPMSEEAFQENEQDAADDGRKKMEGDIKFLNADTMLNIVRGSDGGMQLSVKEGPLQYLLASARSNVGVKSGRYAFEVKLAENAMPKDTSGARVVPRSVVRIGFSTAGSSLILGEGEDSACFDETGGFLHNKARSATKAIKCTVGVSLVVVLNLDSNSPNFNTMSLFKNGERCGAPQALPAGLKDKALFPTVTFKNYTVRANFAAQPEQPLSFKCRMLADAAADDVEITEDNTEEATEVLFPVFLPDEGTFDWLDWYLSENPGSVELSDRVIADWAVKSGLQRQKAQNLNPSNDKPDLGFGIRPLEDGTVKASLAAVATEQKRTCIVMEVKGNLLKEDRAETLKKWTKSSLKKVAQVMIGIPEEEFKKRTHEMMLADKQDKINKVFEANKLKKKEERMKEREVRKAKRKLELANKKEEEKTEDGEKKEEDVKEEAVKEEASEDEPMEDDGEKPEVATLTAADKEIKFRKFSMPDVSSALIGSHLDKFSLPADGEGFDEIRYAWSPLDDCNQYLKDWVKERKLFTRVDTLKPSDWFKAKWTQWQKDLQAWHIKHVEFKDPVKRQQAQQVVAMSKAAGAKSKASPPAQKQEPKAEEKPEEKAKEKEETKEEEKDPMQALEEEMDKEDIDVFGVDDICDMKDGNGTPLFSVFAFEDWALLSLRFELHLLVHAVRLDSGESERIGIPAEHLPYYYFKYFNKDLNTKNYGVETVEELVSLVKDTVIKGMRSKVYESQIADEIESNEIFVKLTEEARRDRQRRIDAGESAQLQFSKPGIGMPGPGMPGCMPGTGMPGNGMPGTFGAKTKSLGMPAMPGVPGVGVMSKAGPPMGDMPTSPQVVRPPPFANPGMKGANMGGPSFGQPQPPAWAGAPGGGFNQGKGTGKPQLGMPGMMPGKGDMNKGMGDMGKGMKGMMPDMGKGMMPDMGKGGCMAKAPGGWGKGGDMGGGKMGNFGDNWKGGW